MFKSMTLTYALRGIGEGAPGVSMLIRLTVLCASLTFLLESLPALKMKGNVILKQFIGNSPFRL